jgi:hypothetical protein
MLRLLTTDKWVSAIYQFRGNKIRVAEFFGQIKWSYYIETVNSKLMCVTYADGTVEDMFPASDIMAYKL